MQRESLVETLRELNSRNAELLTSVRNLSVRAERGEILRFLQELRVSSRLRGCAKPLGMVIDWPVSRCI